MHGTTQRADVPVVIGRSGLHLWTYGETKVGKTDLGDKQRNGSNNGGKKGKGKAREIKQQTDLPSNSPPVEHLDTEVPIVPPPVPPFSTKPTHSSNEGQPALGSNQRVQEIEGEIERLYGLLFQEKQKPGNVDQDYFSHYELISPTGVGKGDPNELYQMPGVRVVYKRAPETAPNDNPPAPATDTSAYHRALTQPYRGELSGGSTSRFSVPQVKGPANKPPGAPTFYNNVPTPPSARALQHQLPGNHPAVRAVPQNGGFTRTEQVARAARQAPSGGQPPPRQHVPARFNQQRYLRDNTAGPSCERFLEEKKSDDDVDME